MYSIVQYCTVVISVFNFEISRNHIKVENQSTVQYVTVSSCNVLYQRCQGTKGGKGVRWQKMPRVPEFKRCQGCQGKKGAKGQKLRRSTQGQGLLKNSSQIELDSWRRSILFDDLYLKLKYFTFDILQKTTIRMQLSQN